MADLKGTERVAESNPLVALGGKLPYSLELKTPKLLDVLMALFPSLTQDRKKTNNFLYSKSRPGFYLEIRDFLHLAYADQRDGHGTPHWWRLFFDDRLQSRIEELTKSNALVRVSEKPTAQANTGVNAPYEWGGMYFRSKVEIVIAEELNRRGLLFFANVRGRFGLEGSPVSAASSLVNGRIELDFLVFHQGQCAILEVDGGHHQQKTQAHLDSIRNRILLREGIVTVHFTAEECISNASDVVNELLGILRAKG